MQSDQKRNQLTCHIFSPRTMDFTSCARLGTCVTTATSPFSPLRLSGSRISHVCSFTIRIWGTISDIHLFAIQTIHSLPKAKGKINFSHHLPAYEHCCVRADREHVSIRLEWKGGMFAGKGRETAETKEGKAKIAEPLNRETSFVDFSALGALSSPLCLLWKAEWSSPCHLCSSFFLFFVCVCGSGKHSVLHKLCEKLFH